MLALSSCLGSGGDTACLQAVDQNHPLLGYAVKEYREKKILALHRPFKGILQLLGRSPTRLYLLKSAQSPSSDTLEPNFLAHRPLGTIPNPNDAILLVFLIIAAFVSLSSPPVLICISLLRSDFDRLLIGICVFFPVSISSVLGLFSNGMG